MRSVISALVIALLHFVISLWLAMKSFGHVVAVYDANREFNIIEKVNYFIVEIMFFPIITILEKTSYEGATLVGQYLPFFLNSMLWGMLLVCGYNAIFHKK